LVYNIWPSSRHNIKWRLTKCRMTCSIKPNLTSHQHSSNAVGIPLNIVWCYAIWLNGVEPQPGATYCFVTVWKDNGHSQGIEWLTITPRWSTFTWPDLTSDWPSDIWQTDCWVFVSWSRIRPVLYMNACLTEIHLVSILSSSYSQPSLEPVLVT